jgi:general secretion pathway protein K
MKAHRHVPRRGAALLLAMLILTLVATLAAGMVWQQWRAIQVEAAERARTQAAWILAGALDWARLILREDARNRGADHLGEPWAVPLAEARLSTFLAADRDNNSSADTDTLDAFLSGSIVDAQARWNLRRLVGTDGKVIESEQRVLGRLCESAGVGTDAAERIATALQKAWSPLAGSQEAAQIAPQRVSELAWLGIDADTLQRLSPFVIILPSAETRVNVNTAPAEVIAAAVEGMSLGQAQRLVQERTRNYLNDLGAPATRALFPADTNPPNPKLLEGVGVNSAHFIVSGRLRLENRVLEERTLIQRRDLDMVVLQRERISLRDAP